MVLDFLFNLFSYTYPCPKTLVFVTKIVGKKFFGTINRGVGLDDMAGYPGRTWSAMVKIALTFGTKLMSEHYRACSNRIFSDKIVVLRSQ